MKRSKDDKRVLRSGNGRQQNSRRKRRGSRKLMSRRPKQNNFPVNSRNRRNPRNPRKSRKQRKSNGKLVFIMIVALIAFVIGAGIGVSLSLSDDNADNAPKFENVTKEMTTNLTNTTDVYFDKATDNVDFNENTTSPIEITYEYNDQ
ncbi:hypothetical protein [Methanobrevibacter sp.]